MKKTYKYILSALMVAGSLVACSPDEISGISENGIPQASEYASMVDISVDQSINQVTFKIGAKDVYGIWTIDTGKKQVVKTGSEFQQIFTTAGDYNVTVQVGNRNGISDGTVTKTFHIDNSIVDFSKYVTMISKAPWYIDNTAKGHMACGPNETDPVSWWAGDPDCKKNEGVYDNCLTFTGEMKYTFDPGNAGTIYVNKGVTLWPDLRDENNDFNVPAQKQETTYNFEVDGDDLYLTFPANTYFPYIAFNESYTAPRYQVVSLTTKSMTLWAHTTGISWQFILSTSHEVAFSGFDVNSADNVWKQANPVFQSLYYAHGGGWEGLPDYEHSEENGVFTVKLPTASDQQWQAQYCIGTELNSTNIIPGTKYDFSCKIYSTKDLPGVTLKLTSPTDDPSLINNQNGPLAVIPALEETVVYFTECEAPTIEGNYKFVFDFGGNPDNTEITIKDICIIDHSKNTITPPAAGGDDDKPEPAVKDWNSSSPANLWSAVESGDAFISVTPWFANDGWGQIGDPAWSHENGAWTLTIPEGMGNSQWQGQFPINTTLAASIDKKYNFYLVLEADNDCPGVTIKLTETDDADGTKHDDNFFFADRHVVEMGSPFIYKAKEVSLPKQDAHALSLFFDFGGTPAGTNIKISEIYFEEVKEVSYDAAGNLWKSVDAGDAFISVTPWFANDSWSQIADPAWSHESGSDTWELTIPEGMGNSQWQGQFPINTTLTASAAKTYSYSVTLEADNDCPGVTIKLTQTDEADAKHDNNFFFADRHDVKAFEEFVYTVSGAQLPVGDAHALSMFFDFGGTPVGTNIKIKRITLIEE